MKRLRAFQRAVEIAQKSAYRKNVQICFDFSLCSRPYEVILTWDEDVFHGYRISAEEIFDHQDMIRTEKYLLKDLEQYYEN